MRDPVLDSATVISELKNFPGQSVTLRGWLYSKRSGGKIVFMLLRDGTGICQCIVEASVDDAFALARELPQESSLEVTGEIRADDRAPGGYEMSVTGLKVIHKAEEYPITRKAHGIDFLMNHRHLWFRSKRPTAILRIRHKAINACRNYLDNKGFTLIDTPILTQGAGEDAQTLFPVDYFGEQAYLAQTGQLHVETACMALRKVYCFGPTFRAEKSKTRRHLTEFWMLEPEIAFAELDEVIELAEGLTCHVVQTVLAEHEEDLAVLGRDIEPLRKIEKPFPRITYQEAMDNLRSEKTKLWLEKELEREKGVLQGKVEELAALEKKLETVKKQFQKDKLNMQIHEVREAIHELEQDLASRPEHIKLAQSFEWGKDLGGSDETIISKQYDKPLFVTDYPRQVKAFYMKVSKDDPRLVRNVDMFAPEGYGEVIGGSQREDDIDVLMESIKSKDLDPGDYSWYLDLRRYGSVPHGGFGLGIERMLAWICGIKHVRETIPFPRLMGKMYG